MSWRGGRAASAFAADRARSIEAGMNGNVAKPVAPARDVALWLPAVSQR